MIWCDKKNEWKVKDVDEMFKIMKCLNIMDFEWDKFCKVNFEIKWFIFQMLSIATVHVQKKKIIKIEKEWGWINEVLVWRLELVWGLG